MKQLRTEIEINASPDKVWAILTKFDKFPDWNPFIKSIKGEFKVGTILQVTLRQPRSKPMLIKPECLKIEKNKEFRWLGHLLFPGLFDGEHIFELSSTSSGSTLFVQRENFKGILVSLFWKMINTKTREGFILMNKKLKELAEHGD